MITVRHRTKNQKIFIAKLQLQQKCYGCGCELQGKWAFHREDESWLCLEHAENNLGFELVDASSPDAPDRLRTMHRIFSGGAFFHIGLTQACRDAEEQGMILFSTQQVTSLEWVASFIGAETQ